MKAKVKLNRIPNFVSQKLLFGKVVFQNVAQVLLLKRIFRISTIEFIETNTVCLVRVMVCFQYQNKALFGTNEQHGRIQRISWKQSEPSRQQHTAGRDGAAGRCASRFQMVLTVRSGVEWVMGLGHISVAGHATGGGASRIRHHPPSRMTQSRLRSAQNTCGVTDWCESHSTHPDPRKRKITIK